MINTGDYKVKKILGSYKNGNYYVSILSDGSKIRSTNEDDFIPAFAESCDCKITDVMVRAAFVMRVARPPGNMVIF